VQEQENDKIDTAKQQAAESWAEEEERKEQEALEAALAGKAKEPPVDPLKDPANLEWMQKKIAEAKQQFGESFGEDIDEDFGNGQ
jgi:hypothetical protein